MFQFGQTSSLLPYVRMKLGLGADRGRSLLMLGLKDGRPGWSEINGWSQYSLRPIIRAWSLILSDLPTT
jgi:hypothetical protein